jgi:hypothetical protein
MRSIATLNRRLLEIEDALRVQRLRSRRNPNLIAQLEDEAVETHAALLRARRANAEMPARAGRI